MRWIKSGVVLGVGLGGFADGIALHQLAQWHNMGSAVLPPVTVDAMSRNMFWDGLFHLATWVITLTGVFMLWSDARHGGRVENPQTFTGEMILGWGVFNLVEGVLDHHLLQLHHVRDMPVHVPVYDWAFLAIGGLGFIALGLLLMRPVGRRMPG